MCCRYGPIPRWVLEQTLHIPKAQWFVPLFTAVESKDAIASLLAAGRQSAADRAVSHIVVHQ